MTQPDNEFVVRRSVVTDRIRFQVSFLHGSLSKSQALDLAAHLVAKACTSGDDYDRFESMVQAARESQH